MNVEGCKPHDRQLICGSGSLEDFSLLKLSVFAFCPCFKLATLWSFHEIFFLIEFYFNLLALRKFCAIISKLVYICISELNPRIQAQLIGCLVE